MAWQPYIGDVQGPRCRCGLELLGENCAYCCVTVGRTARGPKELMGTREALREEASARMDAARQHARDASRAEVEESRAASLAQPPSKPPKKPGKKRGPQKKTLARWAAEDQAAKVGNFDELSPALLNDPLPALPFELDDLQAEIKASLR